MSQLSLGNNPTGAGVQSRAVTVAANIQDVLESLGDIPFAVTAAMHERFYDLTDHHRRSVLKKVKLAMPSGRAGQKLVASRLIHYGAKKKDPTEIDDVQGLSYLTDRPRTDVAKIPEDFFEALETGATVRAKQPFFIPFSKGGEYGDTSGKSATEKVLEALKARQLTIINTPTVHGLVARVFKKKNKYGKSYVGLGVLRFVRKQRKEMSFFGSFDEIVPKHMSLIDKDLESALTAAGRERLVNRYIASESAEAQKQVTSAIRRMEKGAKPDKRARDAMREAAAAAKANAISQTLGSAI